MAAKLAGLGTVLDRRNFEWLEASYPDIAAEITVAINAGAEPAEIAEFMRATIGEHRDGLIATCHSAARYLKRLR